MQLKIQRAQRMGGVMGSTVVFCLDVRAEYNAEETQNIGRYKIGGQVIYNSQAARRHLENSSAHLDRVSNDSLREKATGLARGTFSLAMAKMQLNITIASLGKGHHVECKDLEELIETEDTVRSACKGITRFLQVAETFDGSEVVVEYVNGEENVHITQNAPPLLEYSPSGGAAAGTSVVVDRNAAPTTDFEQRLRDFWANPRYRKLAYYCVGAVALFLLLRSCFG
jgi:hypothetical protein